jgi:hypothetical protein
LKPYIVIELDNIGKTLGRLYLIDASTVSLCLSQYPWAYYVNSKAGIKLHLRLVFHNGITIPDKAVVTPAVQTDKSKMEELIVEEKDALVSREEWVSLLEKKDVLKDFRQIPGVGKSIAEDLFLMGFRSVPELKGQDPDEMYERFCGLKGQRVDLCMLYVFRCPYTMRPTSITSRNC